MIERPKDLPTRPSNPVAYAKWQYHEAWEKWITELVAWLKDHIGTQVLIESRGTDQDEVLCTITGVRTVGYPSEPVVDVSFLYRDTRSRGDKVASGAATSGIYGITRVSVVKAGR